MDRSSEMKLTTPAGVCRVAIFQPTRRPMRREIAVEGPWGAARIDGKLGQQHRDVLDILIACSNAWRETSEHDVVLLVDSADIRRKLGWNRWTYKQIIDVLNDLLSARTEIRIPGWPADAAGIVMRIAECEGIPPPTRRPGARRVKIWEPPDKDTATAVRGGMLWEVTISRGWIALLRRLSVGYPVEVVRMQFGVSQAVTRLMLSHQHGARYKLSTALEAVGVPPKRRRRARREIEADSAAMSAAGVVLEGEIIQRANGPHNPGETPTQTESRPHNPGGGPLNPGGGPLNPGGGPLNPGETPSL